jgi:hypothetical protein
MLETHKTRTPRLSAALMLGASALIAAAGCGERGEAWEMPVATNPFVAFGLRGSVAIVDHTADRTLLLPAESDLTLAPVSIPMGRGFAAAATTPDLEKLLVLCRGDVPRRTADDQGPAVYVMTGGTTPGAAGQYNLSDPLSGLTVDPLSKFAVVYPSADDTSFVTNPNELVLIKLDEAQSAQNPVPVSLRSFGGRPQGFTFTPELKVPGGARRLLIVQTDRDVALVDLNAPEKPEITVKLTGGPDALEPSGLAVSDGAPEADDDARIAIRVKNDPNVIVLDLLPVPESKEGTAPHSFLPVPNIVYVGGTPTDIAFVRTDGGLRLAALVPSRSVLTLVDPATGIASDVELGAPFERISIVTDIVGETTDGSDVALLWSTASANVAFVELGVTVGKPYKSVERIELAQPVASVMDVPEPNAHLKILASSSGTNFVILNLLARTATPIVASVAGTRAVPSPDGNRAWMLSEDQTSIAQLDLASNHPKNVELSYPVRHVFDIERRDGGRAVLAVHALGTAGVTVLDAQKPSLQNSIEYLGILLGEFK